MANITVSLPSDGTSADVADYNTPITTIVNEMNGNLDNTNVVAGAAIATSKLADDAGITAAKLGTGAVETAKIADDAVTDDKMDYPRFWQEIGRTTLTPAGDTITVSSLPARKYLKILVYNTPTGGTIRGAIRFNGDTGNNYAQRASSNGGADATTTSASAIQLDATAGAWPMYFEIDVINVAAQEKMFTAFSYEQNTAGAGNVPGRKETLGKWANTADAISSVSIINTGTGDYAIGSEVVVLGHN